ncbi:MAG: cbb3-type cytochrome c oxidase subunit 3 [Pseudomonadota bacterium]|nr:cbb3-type cytochrome c oxidase subunit 3 [Pseudomonadota bacterium]
MMDHETLRHFADTWGLVFLVVSFVGVVAFLFRPGAKEYYKRAARRPLEDE